MFSRLLWGDVPLVKSEYGEMPYECAIQAHVVECYKKGELPTFSYSVDGLPVTKERFENAIRRAKGVDDEA